MRIKLDDAMSAMLLVILAYTMSYAFHWGANSEGMS